MATVYRNQDGTHAVQFTSKDGVRKTIRLGKVSERQAQSVGLKVQDLVNASITGHAPKRETSVWLKEIGDVLYGRLAAVGLCEERGVTTLASFFDNYTSSRTNVKPGTRIMWARNRGYLVDFFGADKPLRTITEGDADKYRDALLARKLGVNTVGRSCGLARQIFRAAQRRRLIDVNPFSEVKATVGRNEARMYFVSKAEAEAVINACPNNEWKLAFALARFAGLRVPSELKGLRWSDIDWEKNRFTVTSPKTEHQGKPSRIVPLFPELKPYLLEAFSTAAEGEEFVFGRRMDSSVNLRTQLHRIIKRAGLTPWPKLWQNLRASRATELVDVFPSHVCSGWMGHTDKVADKHYRSVTEDHFTRAATETIALQNPMQQAHASECTEAHDCPSQETETALAAVSCDGDPEMAAVGEQEDGLGRIRTDV